MNTKKCPACAENVQAEANVCRHCQFEFVSDGEARKRLWIQAAVGFGFLTVGFVGAAIDQERTGGLVSGGSYACLGLGLVMMGIAFWRMNQLADRTMGDLRRKLNDAAEMIFGLLIVGCVVLGLVIGLFYKIFGE